MAENQKISQQVFFVLGNIVCDNVPEVPLVQCGLIQLTVEGKDQHSNVP